MPLRVLSRNVAESQSQQESQSLHSAEPGVPYLCSNNSQFSSYQSTVSNMGTALLFNAIANVLSIFSILPTEIRNLEYPGRSTFLSRFLRSCVVKSYNPKVQTRVQTRIFMLTSGSYCSLRLIAWHIYVCMIILS